MDCPGTLFIISSPSGGGKTSLIRALVGRMPNIQVSISHTTRQARANEIDGKHYHFISEEQFESFKQQGKFLEYAKVFKHWYGTSREWVEQTLSQGIDVLLDIDWQGARRIREQMSCQCVFIMPPSKEALRARLTGRSTDAKETIEHRMEQAGQEMSHYQEYDFVIINDQFDEAVSDLESVVRAQRLSIQVQQIRNKELFVRLLGNKKI